MKLSPESPAPFSATLPTALRDASWRPHRWVLLTLPDSRGQYTFFEVWRSDRHRTYAFNVGGMVKEAACQP